MYQNKDIFQGLSVPRAIAKFAIPTVLSQLVTLLVGIILYVGLMRKTKDSSQSM